MNERSPSFFDGVFDRLSNLRTAWRDVAVSARSVLGGSFWSELPLKAQEGSARAPDEPWLRGLRLLVVDDNHTVTRVIQEQASHWGMKVRSADSLRAIEVRWLCLCSTAR